MLIKGADFLVDNSSKIAEKFGVSHMLIGLTIVAFGTSLPEFVVNMTSIASGSTDMALGNIIGSNIANILLILGITAIISHLYVKTQTVWREIPFCILSGIILLIMSSDSIIGTTNTSIISRIDGVILLIFFVFFLYYLFTVARKERAENKKIEVKDSNWKIALFILMGIILLYFGGQLVIDNAIIIAQRLGISTYVISATIIAVGTSLPELITSIIAILKKNNDLSIGNAIGSNIVNVFFVLGMTATIKPIIVENIVIVDLIMLSVISILLFTSMHIGTKNKLDKLQGILFVIMYICYVLFLIFR